MFIDFFQYLPPLWTSNDIFNLFGDGKTILLPSLAEKLIRTIIVYFVLVIVLKTFGKRKLTQLNPFDFVVLLLLSNTVQNAIIGNETTLPGGLIGALFLIFISNIVVRLFFKFSWSKKDDILDGKPVVLIKNGEIQNATLERESITRLELESIIHDKGFDSSKDISNCVMESNGKFFVEPKKPSKEDKQHSELLSKIEELSRQIAELNNAKA